MRALTVMTFMLAGFLLVSSCAGGTPAAVARPGPAADAGVPYDAGPVADNGGTFDAASGDAGLGDETVAPDVQGFADDGPAAEDAGPADAGVDDAGFPAPQPDDCIKDVGAGERQITCEGIVYDVSVPDKCVSEPCGLIFDVHGFTMTGEIQDKNTELKARGRQYGYIVVQPNAPNKSWSFQGADDAKVFAFLKRAMAVWHVDKRRVHFTGLSQGGDMTWRFICDHADVLASAAPLSAVYGAVATPIACAYDPSQNRMPSRQIDVLYCHGHKDKLVPFNNARKMVGTITTVQNMTREEIVSQDDTHTWHRWTNDKGAVFEFIEHDWQADNKIILGGHCVPGSDDLQVTLPDQAYAFACVERGTLVWGEEVMKFFIAHPMPD